jgi:hypothetical protein
MLKGISGFMVNPSDPLWLEIDQIGFHIILLGNMPSLGIKQIIQA